MRGRAQPNGMGKPQGFLLFDKLQIGKSRQTAYHVGRRKLMVAHQERLEFGVGGEMRSDQRLMVPDNQNHRLDPTRCSFLYSILNQGLPATGSISLGRALLWAASSCRTGCGDHAFTIFW